MCGPFYGMHAVHTGKACVFCRLQLLAGCCYFVSTVTFITAVVSYQMGVCISRSTVLSRCRQKSADLLIEPLFMPHSLPRGSHISACGHVMHADCWRRFLFSCELSMN